MDQQKFNPRESEQESITPDIPGVKALENNAVKNADGGFFKDKSDSRGLDKKQLSNKESVSGKASNAAKNAALNMVPQGRLIGVAGRFVKKNKIGVGGIAVLIPILIFVFGSGLFLDYAIVTIAKDLVAFETKVEQTAENDSSKHLLKYLLNRQICKAGATKNLSGKNCTSNDESSKTDENASGEEEPLAEDMDDFSFTDPAIEEDLSKNGISVDTNVAGEFTGLSDSGGQEITPDDIGDDNNGVFDDLDDSLPEWKVGQETSFIPQTESDVGADYDVANDEQDDNLDKDIENEVTNGSTSNNGSGEDDNQESAEDKLDDTLSGVASEAASETENGDSEATIIKNAEVKAAEDDVPDDFNLIGALQKTCGVDLVVKIAAQDRIPEVMGFLERHATTLISLADQTKTNKITGKEVSDEEKLFDGNTSLPPTIKSGNSVVRNEASEPFSDSAQWQEITGNPVNSDPKSLSYNAGLSASATPTESSIQAIADTANRVVDDTPLGGICSILNNPILGPLATGTGITVEALDAEDPAADAEEVEGSSEILTTAQTVLLPIALKLILPIGMNGAEDAVQWMNNSGAGENIASNDYARSLGAQPESTSEANAQYAAALTSSDNSESHTSFGYRVFALNNPNSLVSKMALEIPFEKQTFFSDISSFITNIPKEITSIFGDLISDKFAIASSTVQNPGALDGLTQYGFNNVGSFDPIQNEAYLYSDVSYGGASASRISLLGDPNQHNDTNLSSNPDTNDNDLLHCFLQPYNGSNGPANDSPPQAPCETEGNFDISGENGGNPVQIGPNDVAWVYCKGLGQSTDPGSGCMSTMKAEAQANDDVDRFSQYMMDLHIMGDYMAMESTSTGD